MAENLFQFQVDPDRNFQKIVSDIANETGDLRVPFISITKSWFKSNRALSGLKGPGKYTDLEEATKKEKIAKVGSAYPVLFRTGRLFGSLTLPGSPDAISQVINKTALVLGTRVDYAPFHQYGTKHLPIRPMVFIGAEQTAPAGISNRHLAWVKIIEDYLAQVLQKRANA